MGRKLGGAVPPPFFFVGVELVP